MNKLMAWAKMHGCAIREVVHKVYGCLPLLGTDFMGNSGKKLITSSKTPCVYYDNVSGNIWLGVDDMLNVAYNVLRQDTTPYVCTTGAGNKQLVSDWCEVDIYSNYNTGIYSIVLATMGAQTQVLVEFQNTLLAMTDLEHEFIGELVDGKDYVAEVFVQHTRDGIKVVETCCEESPKEKHSLRYIPMVVQPKLRLLNMKNVEEYDFDGQDIYRRAVGEMLQGKDETDNLELLIKPDNPLLSIRDYVLKKYESEVLVKDCQSKSGMSNFWFDLQSPLMVMGLNSIKVSIPVFYRDTFKTDIEVITMHI